MCHDPEEKNHAQSQDQRRPHGRHPGTRPEDIASFIFGSKGLIGDLTGEGSRFKKLDVE